MEAQSFAYWLKGYVELNGTTPTEAQWKIIVDHLEKVFDKQTPNRDNGIQQPTQGPNTSTPYPLPSVEWPYKFRTMELRPSDMPGDYTCNHLLKEKHMTSINTVLPTITQADLSKDEEAIYRVMHTAMGQESLLQLVAGGDKTSEAQREQMRKATRAMLALAQTAYAASVERGVM